MFAHESKEQKREEKKGEGCTTANDVLALIQEKRALVKMILSKAGDDQHWVFLLEQLADPVNKRPIPARRDGINRSRVYDAARNRWFDRKVDDAKRGQPKQTEYTKKTATTLLPPHAKIVLFNQRDPNVHNIGILFDVDACRLKARYVFEKNASTDGAWWLLWGYKDEFMAYKRNVEVIPFSVLQGSLQVSAWNNHVPAHNEILARLSRRAVKAIFANRDCLTTRLNAIHKKLLAEEYLKKELPLLIITEGSGAREYTLQQQSSDLLSGLQNHADTPSHQFASAICNKLSVTSPLGNALVFLHDDFPRGVTFSPELCMGFNLLKKKYALAAQALEKASDATVLSLEAWALEQGMFGSELRGSPVGDIFLARGKQLKGYCMQQMRLALAKQDAVTWKYYAKDFVTEELLDEKLLDNQIRYISDMQVSALFIKLLAYDQMDKLGELVSRRPDVELRSAKEEKTLPLFLYHCRDKMLTSQQRYFLDTLREGKVDFNQNAPLVSLAEAKKYAFLQDFYFRYKEYFLPAHVNKMIETLINSSEEMALWVVYAIAFANNNILASHKKTDLIKSILERPVRSVNAKAEYKLVEFLFNLGADREIRQQKDVAKGCALLQLAFDYYPTVQIFKFLTMQWKDVIPSDRFRNVLPFFAEKDFTHAKWLMQELKFDVAMLTEVACNSMRNKTLTLEQIGDFCLAGADPLLGDKPEDTLLYKSFDYKEQPDVNRFLAKQEHQALQKNDQLPLKLYLRAATEKLDKEHKINFFQRLCKTAQYNNADCLLNMLCYRPVTPYQTWREESKAFLQGLLSSPSIAEVMSIVDMIFAIGQKEAMALFREAAVKSIYSGDFKEVLTFAKEQILSIARSSAALVFDKKTYDFLKMFVPEKTFFISLFFRVPPSPAEEYRSLCIAKGGVVLRREADSVVPAGAAVPK